MTIIHAIVWQMSFNATKNVAFRVTLQTELANQMTLQQNDPFPVANMNYWVATNLTYILGLNTL